ncbi:MAG TPA: UDP-glucose--hexose-1-phosphate uridylyltransferase [Anaerolineales bacterium]|nr:UDP-glucose--hexose-1-phosphate uridylyltransferase [Anaerolineales bacterium]
MFDSPHRRFNPLTGDWVLVSPHRAKRPWLGQLEKPASENLLPYDPDCYLCPGNERAGGIRNPNYAGTFVFDNDFPSLLPGVVAENSRSGHPLLVSIPEKGLCRVVCFSPRHDLTLPELDLPAIQTIITAWTEQTEELGKRDFITNVQVFENKGAMMGCSNPHPHSQIWSQSELPNEIHKELASQSAYLAQHRKPLLIDYVEEEHRRGERVVFQNSRFTALVPFWAVWPFEVLVVAHRPLAYLAELTFDEVAALAEVLKQVSTRFDNLFNVSFPYSMGFHQAPFDNRAHPEWTLHAHFYPPLLRSATVRKFMVGYEMLAMPQRDITPESSAERLRAVSAVHYKTRL